MSNYKFPPLPLAELQPTLTTLQSYAKFIGKVRRAFTPRRKHWFHISLQVNAIGLTTTAIPAPPRTFELQLDLTHHLLLLTTSHGGEWETSLTGQSAAQFCADGLAALEAMGFEPDIDRSLFADTAPQTYDPDMAMQYFQALAQIDALFKQFQGELRQETGPVQLWPHHIDLAMLWFSGRLAPGQDPANEEYADEQLNFGFSPGDDSIPAPYFYITAYPLPAGLTDIALPAGARWHTAGFTAAILPYAELVGAPGAGEKLLTFLRTVQQAGAALMK
jgi:hypothetical protein